MERASSPLIPHGQDAHATIRPGARQLAPRGGGGDAHVNLIRSLRILVEPEKRPDRAIEKFVLVIAAALSGIVAGEEHRSGMDEPDHAGAIDEE